MEPGLPLLAKRSLRAAGQAPAGRPRVFAAAAMQHGSRLSVSLEGHQSQLSGQCGGRAHLHSSEGQAENLGFRFRCCNRFGEGQGLKKTEEAGCGRTAWVWRL